MMATKHADILLFVTVIRRNLAMGAVTFGRLVGSGLMMSLNWIYYPFLLFLV